MQDNLTVATGCGQEKQGEVIKGGDARDLLVGGGALAGGGCCRGVMLQRKGRRS